MKIWNHKPHHWCRLAVLVFIAAIIILLTYNYVNNRTPYSTTSLIKQAPPSIKTNNSAINQKQNTIRILAIDGGGVRGIIPLHVLDYIEQQTGKPISDLFDVIVGTSSGGITAVLLTLPNSDGSAKFTAKEAIKAYKETAPKIFSVPLYHKILTLDGLLGPKFISKNAHEVYQTMVEDHTLNQLRSHVLLPSLGLEQEEPQIFKSWDQNLSNFYVSDVLSGTTSPPTFFKPVTLTSLDQQQTYIVMDASLYMNDPALFGLMETMHDFPDHNYLLVSIGTGVAVPNIPVRVATGWGLLQWLPDLYSLAVNTQTRALSKHTSLMAESGAFGLDYYRINIEIPNAHKLQFNANKKNLKLLDKYGKAMVQDNKQELNEIIKKLIATR